MDQIQERKPFLQVVAVLAIGAILVVLLLYVTIPLLSPLSNAFGAAQNQVVWVGSAFGFAYAIGNIVFGTLSDRIRRKKILVAGLLLLVLSTVAVGLSPSIEWLIAMRIVQGFIAASFPPVALAYVGDVIAPGYRPLAISIISSGFLLAGVLGQLYGGIAEKLIGWSGTFELLAIGYVVLAILVLRLPAGKSPSSDASLSAVALRMLGLLKSVRIWCAYTVSVTILLSFVAMYSGLGPYAIKTFGVPEQGLLWIRVAGIPGILLSPLAGHFIKRLGALNVLIIGLLTAGAGIGFMAISPAVAPLILSSVLFVAGIATAVPGAIVLIGELGGQARGSAIALYGFFIFVGASLGPLLTAGLMPYGFPALGAALATLLCIAAAIAWLGVRSAKSPSTSKEKAA